MLALKHSPHLHAGTYKPVLFSDVDESTVDGLVNLNIKTVVYSINM